MLLTLVFIAPGAWTALSFDEAYNLQIVHNLLHGHGYATDGALFSGHRQTFDYRITTGPTLMLPVAAVTAVLGEHVWVYRLVPTAAYVALLGVWWYLGRRLAGPRLAHVGGAAAVLGVLALDTAAVVYDGRFGAGTVIGESTSTLGVLLAIVLARRPAWAGLCFGLAVMTKVLVLLALPGVVVAVALYARRRGTTWRAAALFFLVAAVPLLVWQVVRVVSVGWADAREANEDFLSFLTSVGTEAPVQIGWVTDQLEVIGVPALGALLLAIGLIITGLIRHRGPEVRSEHVPLVAAILLAGAALELYWLVLESQRAVRHATQASQLLVPLALVLGLNALSSVRRPILRHGLLIAAGSLLVLQVARSTLTVWSPPGPTLEEQRHVADLVAGYGSTYQFVDTAIVPELSLLHPGLVARPLGPSGGVLVLSGNGAPWSTDPCDRILDSHAGYVICEVDPAE